MQLLNQQFTLLGCESNRTNQRSGDKMTLAEIELRLEVLQAGLSGLRAEANEIENRINEIEEKIK